MYRTVFFGKPSEMVLALKDISSKETIVLLFIGLLIIGLGVYPQVLIGMVSPSVTKLIAASLTSKLVI